MKYFLWTIKNIVKIAFWIFLLILLMDYLGVLYGALTFSAACFLWNLLLTFFRYKRLRGIEGARTILRTLFSKNFYLLFIAYGCYCSPKYGIGWPTDGLLPVDGLDEACKRHDYAMYDARTKFSTGDITKTELNRRLNSGDWTFLKEAVTSKNYANGVYLLGLIIGFSFRLIVRSIKMWF